MDSPPKGCPSKPKGFLGFSDSGISICNDTAIASIFFNRSSAAFQVSSDNNKLPTHWNCNFLFFNDDNNE